MKGSKLNSNPQLKTRFCKLCNKTYKTFAKKGNTCLPCRLISQCEAWKIYYPAEDLAKFKEVIKNGR